MFVLEPGEPAWHTGFALPRPLAYGASVSTRDGFHLLGGCDAERCYAECLRLTWSSGKVGAAPLPPLPKPCAMTSAALVGETIYVAGGQDSVKPSSALKNLWALDLSAQKPAWQELPPCPGPARILPVAAGLGRSLYLFSGAELVVQQDGTVGRRYLTDAWRYDPVTGWVELAAMPRAAAAAPSPAMALGGDTLLILGGDDGEYADRVMELEEQHPGFPRTILAYETEADAWREMGTAPVSRVTAPLVYWQGLHVIPSGETRPGIRSPRVDGVRPAR
jgi:N-acetylneuraminic acid mutarotase